MIQYVDDYINDDWEEGAPIPDDWGEGYLRITAEDQSWNKKTLKQLRDEHDIIFMSAGDGVIPVKVFKYGKHYGIVLGSEDDGTMRFERYFSDFKHGFSDYWIDFLIADLQEAKRYIAELKEKEK